MGRHCGTTGRGNGVSADHSRAHLWRSIYYGPNVGVSSLDTDMPETCRSRYGTDGQSNNVLPALCTLTYHPLVSVACKKKAQVDSAQSKLRNQVASQIWHHSLQVLARSMVWGDGPQQKVHAETLGGYATHQCLCVEVASFVADTVLYFSAWERGRALSDTWRPPQLSHTFHTTSSHTSSSTALCSLPAVGDICQLFAEIPGVL